MTEEQERDVLKKSIELSIELTGRKPVGYRAPLYQLRESTVRLLEEHGFEYGICRCCKTSDLRVLAYELVTRYLSQPPRLATVFRSPPHPDTGT